MYKIDEESDEVDTVKYGTWNNASGLLMIEKNIWKRRSNLKGHHLRYVNQKIVVYITSA